MNSMLRIISLLYSSDFNTKESKEDIVRPANGAESFLVVWKHSLEPRKSNFIMAKICISYLLFTVFESHPLVMGPKVDKYDIRENVHHYTNGHDFLDYAAKHWDTGLREAKVTEAALLQLTVDICDTESERFQT